MNHAPALERIAAASGRSPLEVLELFLERASIREYDGGVSREYAEREAVRDVEAIFTQECVACDLPRFLDATQQHPHPTRKSNPGAKGAP